jgi:heptosyltransferase-1
MEPIKILIIRLSSLGDIIHTFPMVQDIKDNIKNVQIDWLVDANFRELVLINKNIHTVYSIEFRKNKKNLKAILNEFNKLKNTLNAIKYDYIIDSQGLLKSAILTKLIRGKAFGFSYLSIKEKLATIFYNKTIEVEKNMKAVLRYRLLAKSIFEYNININEDINFGLNQLIEQQIAQKYIIFFHSTSNNKKKYNFIESIKLLNNIITKYKIQIILPYGNVAEYNDAFKLKDRITNNEFIDIPDKIFTYNEILELINKAFFIIGVDTGLIHLANALNKKTIAIYNVTDPNRTGLIESKNAINIGSKNLSPSSDLIFDIFENMIEDNK